MYLYDYNDIPTTATNSRSNKEMIRAFTELTEELKIQGINPGLNFMDNEAPAVLKITMTKNEH